MEELRRLADAAGYEVLGSLEQVRRHPHPRYNIGSGKARELAEMISVSGAEKVIFGNELKVVQVYNLARLTGVEVIDRFQLILEIFVRRASRREAKLQIELARLQYELAHAREKVRLARISEQPGFLGLGKYEVDVYREAVRRQVHSIQGKLKRVRKTRGMHRHRRRKLGFPSASLAGYKFRQEHLVQHPHGRECSCGFEHVHNSFHDDAGRQPSRRYGPFDGYCWIRGQVASDAH